MLDFLITSPFHVPAGNCFSLFVNPRHVYTGIQEKLKENDSVQAIVAFFGFCCEVINDSWSPMG